MIRLIEAPPGTGKTNIVMDWLTKEVDKGDYKDFYANIENIRVCGVKPLPANADWLSLNPDKSEDFPKTLMIIDEAQYIDAFMKENRSKDNRIGKALSTHRHYGIDFWIITQSAKLLNDYVLLNVGEHVYMYRPRKKKSVRVYWWSVYQKSLSKSDFKNADDEQVYYLNPNMFDLYKSTAVVTDNQVRKSTKLNSILFSAVIVFSVIGFVVYNGFSSFQKMFGTDEDKNSVATVSPDKISSKMKVEEQLPNIPVKTEIQAHNKPIQANKQSTVPQQPKIINDEIRSSEQLLATKSLHKKYLDDYVLEVVNDDMVRPASIFKFNGKCFVYNKYGDILNITQNHCNRMLDDGSMPRAR